ncbi:MAG: phosphodiester glycosidase family protein [Spirochaetaceae bacterium]|jgi:exopolysaccharide biosynthesis protein|nr:phosphodiester glycosidase family protein [Spirochaetaceae bacterium]
MKYQTVPACILFFLCLASLPVSADSPFSTIKDINPQWQSFAQGTEYFEAHTVNPRIQFWALRIDLTDPALQIVVSANTISTTVSSFVRRYDLIAGINANPFSPVSGIEGEKRTIIGITLAHGILVAPAHPSFDALVFFNNGKAAIVNQRQIELNEIHSAVGGFYRVLYNGAITSRVTPRHPRSAAGVSVDGATLFLLVVDGRRANSIGVTEAELGIMLQQLGAFNGLNFDGGGSALLALRYPDGAVRPVNTPIHEGMPGRERAVASCLGIKVVGNH